MGSYPPYPLYRAVYREEMDALAFIEDRCVVHSEVSAPASKLYTAYKRWCEDQVEGLEVFDVVKGGAHL